MTINGGELFRFFNANIREKESEWGDRRGQKKVSEERKKF